MKSNGLFAEKGKHLYALLRWELFHSAQIKTDGRRFYKTTVFEGQKVITKWEFKALK